MFQAISERDQPVKHAPRCLSYESMNEMPRVSRTFDLLVSSRTWGKWVVPLHFGAVHPISLWEIWVVLPKLIAIW